MVAQFRRGNDTRARQLAPAGDRRWLKHGPGTSRRHPRQIRVAAGQTSGGCEIRTREGLPPNTLSNHVGQRSPESATVRDLPEHDWGAADERWRTGVSETETETRGGAATAGQQAGYY